MSNQSTFLRARSLLICAALDKGEFGQECFLEWANMVQLTDIDYVSQKILPAIVHQLKNDELSKQILKLVKFTRLRSQTFLEAGFRAQNLLSKESIPVAWTSGGAVIANTKVSVSDRALDEIGLLVPTSQVEMVTRILQESGFQLLPNTGLVDSSLGSDSESNELAFRDLSGAIVNVHWHSSVGRPRSPSEEALWERVSRAILVGRETFSISPEDLLLQVFARNGGSNQASWVIDATRILEAIEIDFKLLLHISRERRLWLKAQVSLTRLALFSPDLTPKVNRYMAPLLKFAEPLIPRFVRKALDKCAR